MTMLIGDMPTSRNWEAVAWNGVVFCALGLDSGFAATSYDGLNWTEGAVLTPGRWKDIAWNGNTFCACSNGPSVPGHIFSRSVDGVTWTESNPVDINFASTGIAWGNGVFCSPFEYGNYLYTSADGLSWGSKALPITTHWEKIAWSGNLFCTNIGALSTNTAAISVDGDVWISSTLPFSAQFKAVAGGNNIICMLPSGPYASNKSIATVDGVTWIEGTLPTTDLWYRLVWNGTVFCGVPNSGNYVVISKDGVNWQQKTLPISDTWKSITASGSAILLLSATKSVFVDDWSSFWTNFHGQTETIL
jgi:hypothetical protein